MQTPCVHACQHNCQKSSFGSEVPRPPFQSYLALNVVLGGGGGGGGGRVKSNKNVRR